MSPPRLARLGALGLLGLGSALVLGAIGSWPGCTIYDPSLILPGDGSVDGSADGSPPDAAPCKHATWPLRPVATDAGDDSGSGDVSLVAAMRSIDIGVSDGGLDASLPPFGWDLDGVCTCPGQPSCVQAADTTENCDDDAGRDRIGLELFRALGMTAQAGSAQTNADMNAGQYGILVQVKGYNGLANDSRVTAAILASNGLNAVVDGGTPQPKWNGADNWTVDPAYLSGAPLGTDCSGNNPACVPIYSDDNAYVADGVLVAQMTAVPLTFGSRANIGGALMQLSSVVLVGQLSLVSTPGLGGQSWGIVNGSISGRWRASDLLANMATIPDPLIDGSFFCGDDMYYPLFKQGICALQDITSDPTLDNKGAPCNALSMAFAFASQPAQLGLVFGVPAAPSGCTEAGVKWHDTCGP